MIHFPLSMDQFVEAVAWTLVFAHAGVLIWSGWFGKGATPVLALNLLVSGAVVLYWGLNIADLRGSIAALWAFVGFEPAVLITSLLAAFRQRIPRAFVWIAFAANGLICGASLLFMLTFRITRLI